MSHRNALIATLVFWMAGAAQAQDFSSSGSAGELQPTASFDGAYVGFSGGFSRAERDFSSNFGLLPAKSDEGDHLSAGFHAGYGTTFGAIYLGAEGDVRFFDDDGFADSDRLTLRQSSSSVGGAIGGRPIGAAIGATPGSSIGPRVTERAIDISEAYGQRIRETVSAKLRAGYRVDRFMPFVTGGLSVGRTDVDYYGQISAETRVNGQLVGRTDYLAEASESELQVGYNVGAGLEYLVNENLSLRGEYVFTDLGTQRYVFEASNVQDLEVEFDTQIHEARLGFSFRF